MSTDATVTQDLIQTLEDGKDGYARAAKALEGTDAEGHAAMMTTFSQQRGTFSDELQAMAKAYGDDMKESGSATASLHRGWLAVRDALSGSDPFGVLKAVEQGEDHAVSEYEKALEGDISSELRQTVERQMGEVKAARDQVKALNDAT